MPEVRAGARAIREALERARGGTSTGGTSPPPKAEPHKETEPAPPLPELATRAEDEPTTTFVDSSRFLIRGMGDRAGEIAARFFKQVADRGIEDLRLSLGKLIINVDEQRSDSREYYFAERVFDDAARVTMAVRIAPSGTDLFVEWRHYVTPGLRSERFSETGLFKVGEVLVQILFTIPIGLLIWLVWWPVWAGQPESDRPKVRKESLEGFQSQDSTAIELSVRAALDEAIDLAGISKDLIQDLRDDADKNRRVI